MVTTIGLGVAGVGLLSTIVAAPLVIVMEGMALGTGILSIAGKFVNSKLFAKAEKHKKIQVLAKLNTISDHISKAMMDGTITYVPTVTYPGFGQGCYAYVAYVGWECHPSIGWLGTPPQHRPGQSHLR